MEGRTYLQRFWRYGVVFITRELVAFGLQLVMVVCGIQIGVTERTALVSLLCIPVFWNMMKRDEGAKPNEMLRKGKPMAWQSYPLLAVMSVAMTVGLNNLLLLSGLMGQSSAYQETSARLYDTSFVMQLMCLGVVIPIAEELMFRGVLYRRWRQRHTIKSGILLSALLFGVYHGNIVQMLYGFVVGLVFVSVYEVYGRIGAPILMHIVMNMTSCVLTKVDGFGWMMKSYERMLPITVISMVVTGICGLCLKKCAGKESLLQRC